MDELLRIVLYSILGLMLVALSVFIYRYGTRSPWRLTVLGRNLMYQKVILAVLLLSSFMKLFFGHYPGFWIVDLLTYLSILASFVGDTVQLMRIQGRHPDYSRDEKRKARQRVN